MDIKGKAHYVSDIINVTDSFRKRELVVEFSENPQYPEFVKFEAIQDRCALMDNVKVGDDVEVFFNLKGREWTNKQGEKVSVFFNKVLHVPELWTNLFSINTATRNNGTTIICEDELITVKGKNKDIHFQDVTYHGNGKILSTEFKQDDNNESKELSNSTEVANLFTTKMEYNDLHRIMGHAHKQIIKDKGLGIDI